MGPEWAIVQGKRLGMSFLGSETVPGRRASIAVVTGGLRGGCTWYERRYWKTHGGQGREDAPSRALVQARRDDDEDESAQLEGYTAIWTIGPSRRLTGHGFVEPVQSNSSSAYGMAVPRPRSDREMNFGDVHTDRLAHLDHAMRTSEIDQSKPRYCNDAASLLALARLPRKK